MICILKVIIVLADVFKIFSKMSLEICQLNLLIFFVKLAWKAALKKTERN